MEGRTGQAKAGQYLTFVLKGRAYGLPIFTVREINQVTDITPVPQTPDFVIGVINLRGKVIPVVDLRLKFGLDFTPYNRETCIIVIEGENGQIGMIVDQVSEVVEFVQERIEPSPVLGDELNFITGMGKLEDRVIILVDIVKALSTDAMMGSDKIKKLAA
ncbi:MAG: chemotaxis protein CheW [Bdellovibrionota bacterium]